MVVDEGRALVIGVNKWDSCRDREAKLAAIRAALHGGWINVLITDRFVADGLLAGDELPVHTYSVESSD